MISSNPLSSSAGHFRTLGAVVERTGVGIHSGASSRVRLLPAPPGSGIRFHAGGQEIAARAANVVETSRCTVLGQNGVTVSTIEHLMSAFAGMGFTDVRVEIEGPELPIGDGGAALWVEALTESGAKDEQNSDAVSSLTLKSPVMVTGKDGAFIAAYPSDTLRLTVAVSYPQHPLVGTQIARFEPVRGENYINDVAPARTFGFIEEVEMLRKAGLAKGGSLENAIIVFPDHYSTDLRFPNELARHKLLDLMGDMMLSGGAFLPAVDVVAVRPSHRLNVAFAAALSEHFSTLPSSR